MIEHVTKLGFWGKNRGKKGIKILDSEFRIRSQILGSDSENEYFWTPTPDPITIFRVGLRKRTLTLIASLRVSNHRFRARETRGTNLSHKMASLRGQELRIGFNYIPNFVRYNGKEFEGFFSSICEVIHGWTEARGLNRTLIPSSVSII